MFVNEFDGLELEFNPDGFPVLSFVSLPMRSFAACYVFSGHAHHGQGHHCAVLHGPLRHGLCCSFLIRIARSCGIVSQTSDIFTLVAWVAGYLFLCFVGVKLRTVRVSFAPSGVLLSRLNACSVCVARQGSALSVTRAFSLLAFLCLAAASLLPRWATYKTCLFRFCC